MTSLSLLRKGLGLQPLEPLVEAAAAYDAKLETAEGREDIKSGRELSSTDDERATLFTRVLQLSRPLGVRGAALGLAALHACAVALIQPMNPDKVKWLQKLRVPFYAPRSHFCAFACLVGAALSTNAGFRILTTDANACYDYYVRNGLRRRARCLGVPEIVCPIARLMARFSGAACGASAESSCPLEAAAPQTAERVSKSSAPPLTVGLSELNTSTCSKGVEGSHQTTALATPRSASLRTRSFVLPDDVDAAIGVAAAHDSDDDTAWETEEVIEATDSCGARLVSELHYQSQRAHSGRRKHLPHHQRQRSYDSNVGIGEKGFLRSPVASSSQSSPAGPSAPVVLADSLLPSEADATSQASAPSPTVAAAAAAAAQAPLLSRAAFIVRFEQHRRAATRLYLLAQVTRVALTSLLGPKRLGVCCFLGVFNLGLLLRLKSELAYIDCSARASVGALSAWSTYSLMLGWHIYVLNRHVS